MSDRGDLGFDPSDLDGYMVGDAPWPSGGATADVSGLTFDLAADPPADKFDALGRTNPKFWDTWNRRRSDLHDQSGSSYDQALADAAAVAGWDDQEIASLLIAHRRTHGDRPEKALRPDYLARTLGKAAEWRKENENPAIIHLNGRRADRVPDPKDTTRDTEDTTEEAPKKRYTIHHAREAWEPEPPREFLVNPLFERGSISLIYGPPGGGKTYSMLDCAICIALGEDWLNFPTTQTRVLIIDEESGRRRLNRRLREVMRARGVEDAAILYTTLEGFNLRDVRDHRHIEELIGESQAGFVLMDALVDFTPGADENKAQEMAPLMNVLKHIVERTQVHVSMLHHSNKQGDIRGSISIPGVVDLVLSVERKPKSPRVDFVSTKARDIEPVMFGAAWAFDRDEESFQLTPNARAADQDARLTDAQRFVLHHLLENGPSTIEDIESHASGCSPRTARNAVFALANLGRIYRTNPGESRGVPAIYSLIQAAPKERF